MHVIDLSITVHDHDGRLGLETRFDTPFNFDNCGWQGSTVSMFCHYGTHVDAPVHFIKGGAGIHDAPLAKLIGPAGVIDLSDHGAGAGIAADTLEERGRHVVPGDIVILRTGWTDACWGAAPFWKSRPFLCIDGAEWLVQRGVKAIVYDFAEEEAVRKQGFRGEDCVVHHTILGRDIYNIEYVHGLGKIGAPRCAIVALPIKLHGLDGAPARVLAIEGLDLPREFSVSG